MVARYTSCTFYMEWRKVRRTDVQHVQTYMREDVFDVFCKFGSVLHKQQWINEKISRFSPVLRRDGIVDECQ